MSFGNPIVGGKTLIREAIQSPNYVPGVSGWTINRDGTAEFNNVTVRGTFYIQGTNGSYITAYANGTQAEMDFQPPVATGLTFIPTELYTTSTGGQPFFEIDGPQISPALGYPASLSMGQSGVGQFNSIASLLASTLNLGDRTNNPNSYTNINSMRVTVGPDRGEIGRGMVTIASQPTSNNSAAVGATETAVLTTGATVWRANRAYRVRLGGRLKVSAGGNDPQIAIRKTNAAGLALVSVGRLGIVGTGEAAIPNSDIIFTVGTTDITAAICLTLTGTASYTVTQTGNRWLAVYDVGDSIQYPDAVVMV